MAIQLTDKAAIQVRQQLAKRGKGIGLRLGVKRAGCSGYAYVIDFADEIEPQDVVLECQGIKIVVQRDHLHYLEEVEVDYRREGLNEAFQFHNPKAKGTCGCGESFTV